MRRQCDLLGINRSSCYYKRSERKKTEDEYYKTLIFEIYREYPFYGYRKVTKELQRRGYVINRKKVRRLKNEMGLRTIYPRPNLSKPAKGHKIYPYLLKNLSIERPNQVWATDITYLRLEHGFVYLVAILDLYSRKVLTWEISNTLDAEFCCATLERTLMLYGKPEIFNSDQGSQFTGKKFIDILKKNEVEISMDGKGRALDNIYVERLWRSMKYEDVYIKRYDTVKECRLGIRKYFEFYNTKRFHQSLEYFTPDEIYYEQKKIQKAS